MLREMQEDRLNVAASLACNDKCIGTSITNTMLPHESRCMESCVSKYAQAGLIVNISMQKMDVAEAQKRQARR